MLGRRVESQELAALGERIRERRMELRLSQEALAELCNVGTTHISHIETGNCIPSLKVFIAILNARVFNSSKIGKMPAGRIKPVFFCQIFCFIIL